MPECAEVRPCIVEDLPKLYATWPASADVHERHFATQEAGLRTLVVAWERNEAVGSAVICWKGRDISELQITNLDFVEIAHVQVRPDVGGRGVGTGLMQGIARMARHRGVRTIGLGVGVDNSRARALYQRLGFTRTGIVERSEYRFIDESGGEQQAVEWNEYMVLNLNHDPASRVSRAAGDAGE